MTTGVLCTRVVYTVSHRLKNSLPNWKALLPVEFGFTIDFYYRSSVPVSRGGFQLFEQSVTRMSTIGEQRTTADFGPRWIVCL
jgi:hypothetical protein